MSDQVAFPLALLLAWTLLAGIAIGVLWFVYDLLLIEAGRPYLRGFWRLARKAALAWLSDQREQAKREQRLLELEQLRRLTHDREWMRRP